MSTKMGFWRWALASAAILFATGPAGARLIDPTGVTTNEPTALVLYPKLKVDPNTCVAGLCSLTATTCTTNTDCQPACNGGFCNLAPTVACTLATDCPGAGKDTEVQLTNTSEFLTKVHCLYTNTNSHCSNAPATICTDENFRSVCPRGGLCVPGWVETNFHLTLTKRQPLAWSVNTGIKSSDLPLVTKPGQGNPPQFNAGEVPPAPEVPFTGELLCIETDTTDSGLPSDRNDFKGEASEITTIGPNIDVNEYNAIGIKAIEGAQQPPFNVLNIGGPNAEYGIFDDRQDVQRFAGCPNIITVDHFFDGANVVTHNDTVSGRVNSTLTIVPCERDYLHQTANTLTTIQFLVYNEFEQRFSTSTKLDCYKEVRLSDIDTIPGPPGDAFSIFSVGVEGTLTGKSNLRSVEGNADTNPPGYDARTILTVLTENWDAGVCSTGSAPPLTPVSPLQLCRTLADCAGTTPVSTACANPHVQTTSANNQWSGSREQGDQITIQLP